MFKGTIPALVTPFKDGEVDEKAMRDHIDWLIGEGVHGLVPVGTTGESPTLSHEEHKRVVELTIETASGRVPVIAGAGSNNTIEAIDFAQHAEGAGAQGVLVVTPYYNKPNQEGLYAHFSSIAKATTLPLIIYNIPPRSIVDMTDQTMARLYNDYRNITGVKDATADITRISSMRGLVDREFNFLSGEDATVLGFMAHGGHGTISVTANVAPRLCASFIEACLAGDFAKALEYQDRLMPLHAAMFCEPSPGPAKFALSLLGKMETSVRSPIVELSDAAKEQVKAALVHAGLLN